MEKTIADLQRSRRLGVAAESPIDAIGTGNVTDARAAFNRVKPNESAKAQSRLDQIAEKLGTPVSSFFKAQRTSKSKNLAGSGLSMSDEAVHAREGIELNRMYASIRDPKIRRDILDFVAQFAKSR